MRDVRVAEMLAAHVATSTASAELWRRVARGETAPEDAEAELLEGREVGEEERGEIARAKQVFAPPDQARREAILEALLVAQRAAPPGVDQASERSPTDESAVVVPMRLRRIRTCAVGLTVAAAAVVLAVLLARPSGVRGSFPGGYELELDHATAVIRGADGAVEVPTFLRDGKIGLRLVPEDAIKGQIGMRIFARSLAGGTRVLDVDPTVHGNGVVELNTTIRELGIDEGEWELAVAVGWADALPGSWDEVVAAEGRNELQVIRQRIQVDGSDDAP